MGVFDRKRDAEPMRPKLVDKKVRAPEARRRRGGSSAHAGCGWLTESEADTREQRETELRSDIKTEKSQNMKLLSRLLGKGACAHAHARGGP
jgi:hypothetical protein